jgi:hypothetical protein
MGKGRWAPIFIKSDQTFAPCDRGVGGPRLDRSVIPGRQHLIVWRGLTEDEWKKNLVEAVEIL